MTLVNGTTAVRRLSVPAVAEHPDATGTSQRLNAGDHFELTHTTLDRGDAAAAHGTQATHGSTVMRGDTGAMEDTVRHVSNALHTVRDQMAPPAPKVDPDSVVQPGAAMSKDEAQQKVVDIYSAAFPGIGFTEGELAPAIEKLRSGQVSEEDLAALVQEGARLVSDPNAMADQAAQQVEAGRPNRRSVVAQQLRMDRLATLMEDGYLPEGKFNIIGGFSYNGAALANNQFIGGMGENKGNTAAQLRAASTGMSLDMARSLERYTSSSKGQESNVSANADEDSGIPGAKGPAQKGGKQLIKGRASNDAGVANSSTAFGQGSTNQVSLSGATSSSLSQASSELSTASSQTGSPVMLDLNHDGKLGVTGNSSAKDRADNVVNAKVDFDLDGDGKKEHIEWMNGDGDGMLVDDRDGGASRAAAGNGEIDGKRLFGDEGGKFANGYEKMKALDANGDGKLTGHELDGLKSWVDDGDAKVEAGELKTLADLGVTEIDLKMQLTANDRGETLMRATFTQNGEKHISEDVWFAEKQGTEHLAAAAAHVAAHASPHSRAALVARIDSALSEVDNVARQVDQLSHASNLAQHSHVTLLASTFRA